MKKTSKKLLSFFLAIVMVITSCSVGFTAFAADGNKTDKNNSYWKNETTADAAFESIETMLGMALQIDAVKNLLQDKLGMTVTPTTTVSDVVKAVTPMLFNLLSGLGVLDLSVIGGPTVEISLNKAQFLRMKLGNDEYGSKMDYYNKWYEPLDGKEEGEIDFYTLYGLCMNNKDADGELGEFCTETLAALDALYASIPAPKEKVYDKTADQKSAEFLDAAFDATGLDTSYPILEDFKTAAYEDKTLGEVTAEEIAATDAKYHLDYFNNVLSKLGKPAITNLAELLYYYKADFAKFCLTYNLYFKEILSEGEEIDTTYLGVPTGTAAEVLDAAKGTYTYDAEAGIYGGILLFNLWAGDDHDRAYFDEFYEAYILDKLIFEEKGKSVTDLNGDGDIISGYFPTITKAMAKEAGISTNGLKMTEAQFNALAAAAKSGNWDSADQLAEYLDGSNISKPAANYLKAIAEKSLNNLLTMLKGDAPYAFSDSEQSFFDVGGYTTALDRINAMVYSQALIDELMWKSKKSTMENANVTSAVNVYAFYCEYIANTQGEEPEYEQYEPYEGPVYHYSDYAIPESLYIPFTNAMINSMLDLLDMDLIKGIFAGLSTDIDLRKNLTDLWLRLYNNPAETVFELIPVLTVLVDEMILPVVFHEESEPDPSGGLDLGTLLEGLLMGLLRQYTQSGGSDIGIGQLHFDLNIVLPAALHYMTGDTEYAVGLIGGAHYGDVDILDEDDNPTGEVKHYDPQIFKFTNIYIADQFITASYSPEKLAENVTNLAGGKEWLGELVSTLVVNLRESVDQYMQEHGNDTRYTIVKNSDDTYSTKVLQKGLNNIAVALPQLIDYIGKNFNKRNNVKSDWAFAYDGKIETRTVTFHPADDVTLTASEPINTHLQTFKDFAKNPAGKSSQILAHFIDLLIGNWINGLLDFLNDLIMDDGNKITYDLPLVQGLLEALGGFGDKSVITDALNGLFQLKRCDDASFTLTKRAKTNFVGFSNESGYFLITNLIYVTDKYETRGLIPFVKAIIANDASVEAKYKTSNAFKAVASPLLANSKKAKKSAAGTDYSKLLTDENIQAANKLVTLLDELLSSLLNDSTLNGFKLKSNENLLAGVISTLSAYFGAKNTNDLLKLINNYLYYFSGETRSNPSTTGKIGTRPKSKNVDANKVYTSANLSNLVIQTYSLVENIVDYLFYNKDSGLLKNRDPNMLIGDALYGIISPDAVAIRLSDDYSKTKDILLDKDYQNWNSFKVKITAADKNGETYVTGTDYLRFGFSKGDKKGFYKALGESFSGIAAILGTVLTKTYVDKNHTQNWYSNIIYPVFKSLADATGADGVMAPAAFTKATAPVQLIEGIVTPVSNVFTQLYDAPFSFILNLIKGLAGVLDDDSVNGLIGSFFAPVTNHVNGLVGVISLYTPTAAKSLGQTIQGFLSGISIDAGGKDIVVGLINNLLKGKLDIKLPSINWKKLAAAKSPAEVLLLVYGYVVDTVLGSEMITSLLDALDPSISKILKNLSAAQLLNVIRDILAVVQSPTEVFWTFSEYAHKLTNTFSYPRGITASKANKAVDQLDNIVENVFPLLNSLGVTDIEGLNALINDKLYTNEIITTIAKALYGALTGNSTVVTVMQYLNVDPTPAGVAGYLMDKSYGKTYSSAAATLRKAKSWDQVKSVNWGFTNGTKNAQTGFINGLAAALRPLNNILSILLVEGKLDLSKLDIEGLIKGLATKGETEILTDKGENAATLTYKLKDGIFTLTVQSYNTSAHDNRTTKSVFKMDLNNTIKDLDEFVKNLKIGIGTNGYENAIIPILEAFMCDGVKTYKQYKADYKKAKDNLLINILKPIGNLITTVADKPFDTLTAILPNVAYFIDSCGVSQAVANLLAPITAANGLVGVLKKNGMDIDKLLTAILGKDLGKVLSDLLGVKTKLNLKLGDLKSFNIQDIVVPLVQKLLKDKLGLSLPSFTFKDIASHGTVKTVVSKARNDKGKFLTEQVQARQGEVLVAVLRYVADTLIKNANELKKMIGGIDAIKNNKTLKNIINSVFDQIAVAKKDDIVNAVFYLLAGSATDRFFDYRNFQHKEYKFSYGELDEDFCRQLAPMLDGLVKGLINDGEGLPGLVNSKLYTDELIGKLATGLYGAIEGVKINDKIGTLTDLLKQTEIDFSTSGVAALLVNSSYGQSYPQAAATIRGAGSWKRVNAKSLKWGVKDRDSFLHALTAVLRPLFGVLDVLLNNASLNLFNLISLPGSDGYTSTIVPLLEAFGVYNIKTQYQYREDIFNEYDSILLDILNPLWDKVEDILAAPVETLMNILPNLSLFFANDGLLQLVENLLTPVSALLDALKPIVDVNKVLKAANLDVAKLLKDKVGLSIPKFDIYDLSGTLKPLVGADKVVGTLNSVLKIIKIKGKPLNLELPDIDWFKLASHGEFLPNATSQAATLGGRIAMKSDEDETFIAVLRYLIETINYKDNYDKVVDLVGGLVGDNDTVAGVVGEVFGLLKGDTDQVIKDLVELLQTLGG